MKLLAFDTCMAACSAALFDVRDDRVLASDWRAMVSGHAEALPGMIAAVCQRADVPLKEVSRIAVTVGPGSFTGVRIGIAMARGLALALGSPAIGLTSLAVIAAVARQRHGPVPVIAAADARRGALYVEYFGNDEAESRTGPALLPLADVASWCPEVTALVAGTGAAAFIGAAGRKGGSLTPSAANPLPDAQYLARLAAWCNASSAMPAPLYLRPPDAKPQAPLIVRADG